jgi:thermitase
MKQFLRYLPILSGFAIMAGCSADIPTAPTTEAARPTPQPAPTAILFEMKSTASREALAAFEHGVANYRLSPARRLAMTRINRVSVTVPDGKTIEDVAAELQATGAVEYAEPDAIVRAAAMPSDSLFTRQWHHAKINSATAWNYSIGSNAVTVAVCDVGVQLNHPDLAANILGTGYNIVDYVADGSPFLTDTAAGSTVGTHGTKVAGMIGATGNNLEGVTGVNWAVNIMPIRITNDTMTYATISKLIECIDYARTHGARVVNQSYSGVATSAAINSAGLALQAAGGLLVVSAGNDHAKLNTKNYPGIIVVGGTDENDALTTFSNFGPSVDIVAPAIRITTTRPTWRGTYIFNESGTSFASPLVAGAAALIMAFKPSLSPATVQSILFASSRDLGARGYDTTFGNGRLDLGAALALAATYK